MATCATCGTSILFGGVKDRSGLRYCSKKCHTRNEVGRAVADLPEQMVAEHLVQIHQGPCPRCGGPGPVDAHRSHHVYSLLVMTRWQSRERLCCRRCGVRLRLRAAASSALLGWWGFPWGVCATPVQIMRNLGGLVRLPKPSVPSPAMERLVRYRMGRELLQAQRELEKEDGNG